MMLAQLDIYGEYVQQLTPQYSNFQFVINDNQKFMQKVNSDKENNCLVKIINKHVIKGGKNKDKKDL